LFSITARGPIKTRREVYKHIKSTEYTREKTILKIVFYNHSLFFYCRESFLNDDDGKNQLSVTDICIINFMKKKDLMGEKLIKDKACAYCETISLKNKKEAQVL
jgi:hypothetical protein